jgi:hypothetical protein
MSSFQAISIISTHLNPSSVISSYHSEIIPLQCGPFRKRPVSSLPTDKRKTVSDPWSPLLIIQLSITSLRIKIEISAMVAAALYCLKYT